jgi:hypothetical protein
MIEREYLLQIQQLEHNVDWLMRKVEQLEDILKNHTLLVADDETEEEALEKFLENKDGIALVPHATEYESD